MLDSVTSTIAEFLNGIGLRCREGEPPGRTFLPGIAVVHGAILFDSTTMTYPGDLLHKAGHLAVMPVRRRRKPHLSVGKRPAER